MYNRKKTRFRGNKNVFKYYFYIRTEKIFIIEQLNFLSVRILLNLSSM